MIRLFLILSILHLFCLSNIDTLFAEQKAEEPVIESMPENLGTLIYKGSVVRAWKKDKKIFVSIREKDADIRKIFEEMAEANKTNIILSPEVTGKISLSFHYVPWDTTFEQILLMSGCSTTGNRRVHYISSHNE